MDDSENFASRRSSSNDSSLDDGMARLASLLTASTAQKKALRERMKRVIIDFETEKATLIEQWRAAVAEKEGVSAIMKEMKKKFAAEKAELCEKLSAVKGKNDELLEELNQLKQLQDAKKENSSKVEAGSQQSVPDTPAMQQQQQQSAQPATTKVEHEVKQWKTDKKSGDPAVFLHTAIDGVYVGNIYLQLSNHFFLDKLRRSRLEGDEDEDAATLRLRVEPHMQPAYGAGAIWLKLQLSLDEFEQMSGYSAKQRRPQSYEAGTVLVEGDSFELCVRVLILTEAREVGGKLLECFCVGQVVGGMDVAERIAREMLANSGAQATIDQRGLCSVNAQQGVTQSW